MFKYAHSVIYIAITALPLVIDYFLKIKYKKLREALKNQEDDEFYHHPNFLNMNNFNCRDHLRNKVECNYYCTYVHVKTLCNFICSAKESICICMYIFTLNEIHVALRQAHENGVRVRIIIDKHMLETKVSRNNFRRLDEKGIHYKFQISDQSLMHHKFCLIDKENEDSAKMFFGTTNLTMQALCSNFDYYIFTNNKNIIARYSEEFDELWENFYL